MNPQTPDPKLARKLQAAAVAVVGCVVTIAVAFNLLDPAQAAVVSGAVCSAIGAVAAIWEA